MLNNVVVWVVLRLGQIVVAGLLIAAPNSAWAHTSEGGFVLLLPTDFYIVAGTVAVGLSIAIIQMLPNHQTKLLFGKPFSIGEFRPRFMVPVSFVCGCIFWILIGVGLFGPRDPLENMLVLAVWTLWWQAFLIAQAFFGNLWAWFNPWTGIYQLVCGRLDQEGFLTLPKGIGKLPAVIAFVGFGLFLLADIAPDDPLRLAVIVASYWGYIFLGMIVFGGKNWLEKAECFTVLFQCFSLISPFAIIRNQLRVGFPGWRIVAFSKASFWGAVFVIIVLATGSFDGLNETFWWFEKIGINPLEFPGRSSVVVPNAIGLLGANLVLVCIVMGCMWGGHLLARSGRPFAHVFPQFAFSLIPIAVGYHFSHYLTSFLVNIQYVATALSDPFNTGEDYFNLGKYYVSSGFLNSRDSVEIIWLSQALAVVSGHVIGVLSAHAIALKYYENPDRVRYSQLPMAILMIGYTVFGLWLLATPRGA